MNLWKCMFVATLILSGCGGDADESPSAADPADALVRVDSKLLFNDLSNLEGVFDGAVYVTRQTDKISRSFPPAPSDTRSVLIAMIENPHGAVPTLANAWTAFPKENVPCELRRFIRDGELFTNRAINDSFGGNKYFCHGLVLKNRAGYRVYVIASDIDHPIVYNKER